MLTIPTYGTAESPAPPRLRMSYDSSPRFAVCALVFLLSLAPLLSQSLRTHASDWGNARPCGSSLPGVRVSKSEVFLGLSKPDGSTVSDAEFQRFIDAEAPRLPDGFTVVAGNGQFKDSSGTIIREEARVLIVLYAFEDSRSSKSIEKIRTAYKAMFQQESVLRVDGESCASL
jgi:Protein of unknown function (DUF3574)